MSIHETMIAVAREVTGLAKKDHNDHQKFNFRGIDAVMNAFGPAMRTHGLIALPTVEDITVTEKPGNNGKATQHVRVKMRLTFVNDAGETDERTVVWGEAMDWGDKATAKAHSVALRTAYLQAFCLPTDERDPDHDTYEVSAKDVEAHKTKYLEAINAESDVKRLQGMWRQTPAFRPQIEKRVEELQKAGDGGDATA